jgi:hypothetical protein
MKVLIHLLIALVIVDILWLVIIMPYWNSKSTHKNAYWDSLSGLHSFTLVMAFLELFIKVSMAGLIFIEYRNKNGGDISELLKFGYSAQSFPVNYSNDF